jgi:hypothetical protein
MHYQLKIGMKTEKKGNTGKIFTTFKKRKNK